MFIVDVIKNTISLIFYSSYKTGQFIVTTSTFIVNNLVELFTKLYLLVYIILEDFNLFIHDVIQRILIFVGVLSYIGECLISGVAFLTDKIFSIPEYTVLLLTAIINLITSGIIALTRGVLNLCTLVKHLIVLFGDGVWFVLMFVPRSIISIIQESLNLVKNSFVDLQSYFYLQLKLLKSGFVDFVKDFYYFVTDVPLESALGLCAALCIAYIFYQFHVVLISYFRDIAVGFIKSLYYKYRYLKSLVWRHLSNNESSRDLSLMNEDRFCIICQDRFKCILILPCKHLCLCDHCAETLLRYNETCPMCRKPIKRVMKVFV